MTVDTTRATAESGLGKVARRWGPVGAAAVVWWVLYHWNRPFWNWAVFDTLGLDADSHWGEAVHFFDHAVGVGGRPQSFVDQHQGPQQQLVLRVCVLGLAEQHDCRADCRLQPLPRLGFGHQCVRLDQRHLPRPGQRLMTRLGLGQRRVERGPIPLFRQQADLVQKPRSRQQEPRPMPRDAPVTIASLPDSFISRTHLL